MENEVRAADAPYGGDGLRSGDVIHAVNGKRIKDLETLRQTVGELDSGDPVVCQIERGGRLEFVAFEIDL
jgi:serine protease Do